jgi:hypothetical protein
VVDGAGKEGRQTGCTYRSWGLRDCVGCVVPIFFDVSAAVLRDGGVKLVGKSKAPGGDVVRE